MSYSVQERGFKRQFFGLFLDLMCLQVVSRDGLEAEDRRFRQASMMIVALVFSSLALYFVDAPQVLIAHVTLSLAVAILPIRALWREGIAALRHIGS